MIKDVVTNSKLKQNWPRLFISFFLSELYRVSIKSVSQQCRKYAT